MNWYLSVIKDYAVFTGRARRKEYWMFFLFYVIFALATSILDHYLGTESADGKYGLIYLLYSLALFCLALGLV